MLAVQRPRMGSSKPPNQDMPFGYSFDVSNTAYPFPSPPAPAPGPSLLDDNESRFLESFFDGVSSDQFNPDFFSTVGDGMSDLGFPWQELPPNFMGTSTSFGQQPQMLGNNLPMTFPDMNGHMALPQADSLPSAASADVLAAATLLQNGQNGRTHGLGGEALYTPTPLSQSMGMIHSHNQNMMPYEQQRSRPAPPKSDGFMRDNFFDEMVFGSNPGHQAPKAASKSVEIRWGSDSGFCSGQGFVAPPNQVTLEKLEQNMTNTLECFEADLSTAENTQPSSPAVARQLDTQRRRSTKIEPDDAAEDEDDSRTRKRRKSKIKLEDDDGEEDPGASNKPSKKRRTKSVAGPSSSTTESPPPPKRRKSHGSGALKPSRENLTEDQKRENHIKSEQKRRTLIKEGFDDLNELVPALKGGGFSKSAVLIMAADWLEDLIKGNKLLRARLDELEGRK